MDYDNVEVDYATLNIVDYIIQQLLVQEESEKENNAKLDVSECIDTMTCKKINPRHHVHGYAKR